MENEVKEAAPKYNFITPAQYLEMERAAEYRSEYYDGYVRAMSSASLKHNRIARNLYNTIGNFLKEKSCEILPSEMRVSTPSHDSYMYPDALIVCGKPELEDDKFDTLKNPSVIFEILSLSTAMIDKGRKFFFYQQIPSLMEYIMIDSLQRFIQLGRKQFDGSWRFEQISDPNGVLTIKTIDLDLPLSEIYDSTEL
ncbi:MAG TPA: Uma2 family endonuclease [Chitinophagaceae bacterium]|jgi:Uma2 family endonuclease|nr:Uma2 family endonuclease [Chitinophagaceae bacterium]